MHAETLPDCLAALNSESLMHGIGNEQKLQADAFNIYMQHEHVIHGSELVALWVKQDSSSCRPECTEAETRVQ